MILKIQTSCSNIDWDLIPEILKLAGGMKYYDKNDHRRSFENSYALVFAYDEEKLIGFGRAISDGVFQAAIYDIAVLPEYQRKRVGKTIINSLLQKLSGFNVILYSTPGKESFYESLSFKRMKTGMALFHEPDNMSNEGYNWLLTLIRLYWSNYVLTPFA